MNHIKLWERFMVTDIWSKGCHPGEITFDLDKCNKCGLCMKACPGNVITPNAKKEPVYQAKDELACVACGACTAICPQEAISITREVVFTGRFRMPRRGEPSFPRLFEKDEPLAYRKK